MRKLKFESFKVGQLIQLKIVEANNDIIIVSFQGKLLRVSNKTEIKFKENNFIQLIVKKINPIEFALPSQKGFDVWV